MEWQAFFMGLAKSFLSSLGIPDGKQRFVEKQSWERAHYSIQGFDQEVYLDRWGWTEVAGFNDRADYDLKSHMKESGVDMTVFKTDGKRTVSKILLRPVPARIGPKFRDESAQVIRMISGANPKEVEDSFAKEGFYMAGKFKIAPEHVDIMREETEERGRHFVPHVIEPSFGSDRLTYAALEYAYTIKNDRVVLRLPRDIVPTQIAVLPLVSKDGLPEQATKLHKALLDEGFTVDLDESGSIGRRYARFDEIGTPLCVAVDYQTLEDETVTLRDRDSWDQVRAKIRDLPKLFNDYFGFKLNFKDLGSPFKIG